MYWGLIMERSHKMENLASVLCTENVRKQLPGCEHSAIMPCHKDPDSVRCHEPCRGALSCCSRTCKAHCGDCQTITRQTMENAPRKISRIHHQAHLCERTLYCQHKCGLACSQDHQCNSTCKEKCRQQCSHNHCKQPCSVPCAPCMEPCMWQCEHASCPVLCGSVCRVLLLCRTPLTWL